MRIGEAVRGVLVSPRRALRPAGSALVVLMVFVACSVTKDGPEPGREQAASAVLRASGAPACTATQHPRLWLGPADVTRLQGWATSSNAIYQQGILPLVAWAQIVYSSSGRIDPSGQPIQSFFPPALNGQPNSPWPDDGADGVGAQRVETYAQLFAFMSLLSTDPSQKATYAQQARNLLMHAMNAAASCPSQLPNPAPPYCSPVFSRYNRANYFGEAWGLTVDWIYPYLSASDKATIRTVFLAWAQSIVSGEGPQPVFFNPPLDPSNPNDPRLLSNRYDGNNTRQFRSAANNYYSGAMRDLVVMVLSLDPADDPPVNPTLPASTLGNTLASYLPYVFDVVLYQQYAMYEDPQTVIAAYNLQQSTLASVDGPGLASGGLSVEGTLYGHSLAYVMEDLLALHTAGCDNPSQSGPQAGLFASGYWDHVLDGFLSSLTLQPVPYPSSPSKTVYQMASYGDLLFYYVTDFDYIPLIASLGVRNQLTGNAPGRLKALWALVNAMPGGQSYLPNLLGGPPVAPGAVPPGGSRFFANTGSSAAILAYMALDPSVPFSSYADPRPSMPTTFHAKPISRLLARTDWTPSATWLTHRCSWESINHENGDCGQFEIHRKGEWLTSERHGYDNNGYNYAPDYHNTISVQNDLSRVNLSTLNVSDSAVAARGGQWNNDGNAGDPVSIVSAGDALPYAYAQDTMTNLYNRVVYHNSTTNNGRATAVKHASRSLLWRKPDHVVIYDRATTGPQDATSPNLTLFKRFNLLLLPRKGTTPTIAQNAGGYLTTETTPSGQSLYVETLLPANVAPTLLPMEAMSPDVALDPTNSGASAGVCGVATTPQCGVRLRVEDAGTTSSSTHFLHVLQGADPGQPQDPVTLLGSSAGTQLQGASIATGGTNVVVLFLADLSQLGAFTSTSYAAPAGPNDDYVVDLQPSTTYYVTTGATVTISTSPGAGTPMVTDAGGVLHVTFSNAGSTSDAGSIPDAGSAPPPLVSAPVTLTLRRAGGPGTGAVFDTLLNQNSPTNASGASNMTMATGPLNGMQRDALIQFDLGAIPSGASLAALNAAGVGIVDARLVLTEGAVPPSGAGTTQVHRITAAWTEATASWSNSPTYDPTVVASFSNGFGLGSTSSGIYTYAVPGVPLSSLVTGWLQATFPNDGVLLEDPGPNHTNFVTSEWSIVSQRPALTVTYTLTCDPGFGDCNGNGADGCETPITTTQSCGACGNACATGQVCQNGTCL